jgi:cellulose synthase/poly-beta-1,6-N-acetylglucosamine synthase-like glycosyltransferase
LTVVDKDNGGKADSLNCALNFARYRYICTIDGDTFYFPAALLNAMRPAMEDPDLVVGISCPVTIHRRPEESNPRGPGGPRLDRHLLTNFQQLDYLRSFLNTRLGSTRGHFMLCASGAFALWRRDVAIAQGGFSTKFTCEDIEFTFRVHEAYRRRREPYRIISLGTIAGVTETPPTLGALVSQRARWQRVILETVWAYRRMFLNPRYGSVGTVGVPIYLFTEVLAPVIQVLSLVLFAAAWWQALLDRRTVQLLFTVAFANGILTNSAILLQDLQSRSYTVKDLVWLILLGPLDLFLYRPIILVAQTKGLVDFIRGEKGWHEFVRHVRRTPKSAALKAS